MDFTQVTGYDELDSNQISWLANVYAQHMDTLDDPVKYDLENIKKVSWNNGLQTVDVHFVNGELVHYNSTGKWTYE